MQAKIARWGNSLGLRIPAEVARQLGFQEGQVVELTPKKAGFEVTPKREGRPHTPDGIPIYSLEELLADMDRLGPEAEPPTLNWGPDRGSEIIEDAYSRGEITYDDIVSGRAAKRR